MSDLDTPLSPDGARRQGEILALARRAARVRRHRRWARNAAGSAAVAVLAVVVILYRSQIVMRAPAPHTIARVHQPSSEPASAGNAKGMVSIEYVHTEVGITARLSLAPERPQWQPLDDDTLLRSLADAGHPAGLMRVDGRAILMSR